MSTNMSSIVFDVGYSFSLSDTTPGLRWPERLHDIYPQNFSDPQIIKVPIYGFYTNATRDCGISSMLNYASDTYNCAALSIAATLAQKHNFSLDHPSVSEADEYMDFGDLLSFNATGVLQQIVGCASNSCGGSGTSAEQNKLLEREYGQCWEGIGDLSPSSVNGDDLRGILNPLKFLCSQSFRDVEADIAGPGIIVSYMLQIILCVWFFMFGTIIPREPSHSVFLWWVRVKRWLCDRARKRKQPPPPEGTRPRSALSRLRSSRFSAALFSTIIEYQETQLFLTLALQLATMFMVVVNEELSTPMDLRAARTITSGQTLMALLTQTIIQRRGMHWWYTLALTIVVGGLGITIRALISTQSDLRSLPSASGCGTYDTSILELCPGVGSRKRFSQDSVFSHVALYAVTTFVLLVDQLRHVPRVASKLARLREEEGGGATRIPVFFHKSASVVWNLGWFMLTLFLFLSLLINATYIFEEVGASLNKKEKWTFGQVVAVLPWAPVVAKYIYYNSFGIENGVSNRIDHHYKVVRGGSRPGPDRKQSDARSLVSDEYISLGSVGGDSRRHLGPEATGWGRASPGEGGPEGDLGSRVYRTTNL